MTVVAVGAALTARPLLGHAWSNACAQEGLGYTVTTDDLDELQGGLGEHVGIVLVDLAIAGEEDAARLRRGGHRPVLLTPPSVTPHLAPTLAGGFDGVITTADAIDHARSAVRLVAREQAYASPRGVRLLLDEHRHRAAGTAASVAPVLSTREREVLEAMVEGLTTKAIAHRLGIAVKTVEAHRTRLFVRLRVTNQREAVLRAVTEPRLLEAG